MVPEKTRCENVSINVIPWENKAGHRAKAPITVIALTEQADARGPPGARTRQARETPHRPPGPSRGSKGGRASLIPFDPFRRCRDCRSSTRWSGFDPCRPLPTPMRRGAGADQVIDPAHPQGLFFERAEDGLRIARLRATGRKGPASACRPSASRSPDSCLPRHRRRTACRRPTGRYRAPPIPCFPDSPVMFADAADPAVLGYGIGGKAAVGVAGHGPAADPLPRRGGGKHAHLAHHVGRGARPRNGRNRPASNIPRGIRRIGRDAAVRPRRGVERRAKRSLREGGDRGYR